MNNPIYRIYLEVQLDVLTGIHGKLRAGNPQEAERLLADAIKDLEDALAKAEGVEVGK